MLSKWSQIYYHDFNPALVIPKCGLRGDTDLQPASSSDLSCPDLPITVSLEELLLKTDVTMCHDSRYVVSGQLLAQADQVASEKCTGNMYHGAIL